MTKKNGEIGEPYGTPIKIGAKRFGSRAKVTSARTRANRRAHEQAGGRTSGKTGKQADGRAGERANRKTGKRTGERADERASGRANGRTGERASGQAGKRQTTTCALPLNLFRHSPSVCAPPSHLRFAMENVEHITGTFRPRPVPSSAVALAAAAPKSEHPSERGVSPGPAGPSPPQSPVLDLNASWKGAVPCPAEFLWLLRFQEGVLP